MLIGYSFFVAALPIIHLSSIFARIYQNREGVGFEVKINNMVGYTILSNIYSAKSFLIGLYHSLDGISNPKYKSMCFLTTIIL